jgi:hypothetical protein
MTPPPSRPPRPSSSIVEPGPDDPPSAQELADGEVLRRALDDPNLPHEEAALARAVALANAPRPLDSGTHRVLIENALTRATGRKNETGASAMGGRARTTKVRFAFGAGAATLALAAAILLVVGSLNESTEGTASPAARFRVRSTQPLFGEPFSSAQAERDLGGARREDSTSGSSRIDRIAMSRAGDFRENEFARWGTR